MLRIMILCSWLALPLLGCASADKAYQANIATGRTALERERGLAFDSAAAAGKSGKPGGGEAQAPRNEPMPYLAVVEPRKVIYTGQFSIVVGEVAPALTATKKLAEQLGGYMQQLTSSSIVFRVPADKFDQAVAALEKIGAVTDKSISAQDVTEQYTDLQIRLTNAKALLEKLRALLDKAQDVKAALEVEKELARVRTEIEQMEGQINRLQSQVAFATITANFMAMKNAPSELKVNLPFWWLKDLGLDHLLNFRSVGIY